MGRRRLYCATLRARRTKRLDQRHEIARDRDDTPRSFGPRPRWGPRCIGPRPRRWALCPRWDRDETLLVLDTVSRPRPHPWQWHQLGHMQVCTLLQTAPHHSVFYRPDALPAAQPTASKHWRPLLNTVQNKIITQHTKYDSSKLMQY